MPMPAYGRLIVLSTLSHWTRAPQRGLKMRSMRSFLTRFWRMASSSAVLPTKMTFTFP